MLGASRGGILQLGLDKQVGGFKGRGEGRTRIDM